MRLWNAMGPRDDAERHDRARPPGPVDRPAVLPAVDRALVLLLHAKGETALNLGLMPMDEQFLDTPFFGVGQMAWHLRNDEQLVNEKRIRRLMRLMRPMPIYPRPDTSRPARGHKTYPCLPRGLRVTGTTRSGAPTSPICRCGVGFPYLVSSLDRFTRKVLAWRISNTLEAEYCKRP